MRIFLFVLLVAGALQGAAQEFCAVRVVVTSPKGAPLWVPVKLYDPAGKLVKSLFTDSASGVAELCDFGFGEHSIRVGQGGCSEMVIPSVVLCYGATATYRVILNGCPCAGFTASGCQPYLRIASDDGVPLKGATVNWSESGRAWKTDVYGRVKPIIPIGVKGTLRITAPNYQPAIVPLDCRPGSLERFKEFEVKMAPLRAKAPAAQPAQR